jgi:hypothetical protein
VALGKEIIIKNEIFKKGKINLHLHPVLRNRAFAVEKVSKDQENYLLKIYDLLMLTFL